jgi:hypothetical protein
MNHYVHVAEKKQKSSGVLARKVDPGAILPVPSHFYYVLPGTGIDGGVKRRKLTYGEDPEKALATLRSRGGAEEENRICAESWISVSQSELPFLVAKLKEKQN